MTKQILAILLMGIGFTFLPINAAEEIDFSIQNVRIKDEPRLETYVEVVNSALSYEGRTSTHGSTTDQPVFQVKRIARVGALTHTEYADFGQYNQAWDDRGTIFPTVTFTNEFSFQLDGMTGSYLLGPAAADYNFANTSAFTLALWIKTSTSGLQDLIHKQSGSNNGYSLASDSNGRVDFEFRGTGTGDRIRVRTDSIVDPLNEGIWRFIAVTKDADSTDATSIKVYTGRNTTLTLEVLNVLNDTLSGVTTSATEIGIGALNTGGSRFTGNIDEIAIWDKALTQAEVASIFDIQSGAGTVMDGLVTLWRMGDATFVALPIVPDEISVNDLIAQSGVVEGSVETEVPR